MIIRNMAIIFVSFQVCPILKEVLFLHFGHVRSGVQGLQNVLHPRAYEVLLEGEGAHGCPEHT